jgi:Zn-dependent peptidase ImmA (M78 family)
MVVSRRRRVPLVEHRRVVSGSMSIQKDATAAAERILGTFWGDDIPVDPVRIARGLGIQVLDARLDPQVAGALVKKGDRDPSIVLNADDSSKRKRFTCAHEIGHYVKRDATEEYEYLDLRGQLASAGTDPDERYANAFAASLLMPERQVRRLHKDGFGEVELAAIFDVSREAMHYRLTNLSLHT